MKTALMTPEKELSHSESQAKVQLESIIEMVRALDRETAAEDWLKSLSLEELLKIALEAEDDGHLLASVDMKDADAIREGLLDAMTSSRNTFEPEGFEWDEDAARRTIQEDPLSVEVRTGWHAPGTTSEQTPEEFMILLCTGGPAVRLMGELDQHGCPDRVWMEHQDWGTPWTEYVIPGEISSEATPAMLTYAQQFLGF